jgi:hypothetical protein
MQLDYNLKVAFKIISHSRKELNEKEQKRKERNKVMN